VNHLDKIDKGDGIMAVKKIGVSVARKTTLARRSTPLWHHTHRKRRSKGQTVSALDSIKGVGEKTRITLLQHFKSLKRIREASPTDLAAIIGPSKAQIIYTALHSANENA
jgi:ERCC4-type nuclease